MSEKRNMGALDKIRRLTKNQLQVLDALLKGCDSSTSIGLQCELEVKELGGILSALSRNHLIEVAGIEEGKRTMNWILAESVQEKRAEVINLITKILSLYK